MSSVVTRSAAALGVRRPRLTTGRIVAWVLLLILGVLLLAAPAYWTTYGLSNILTKAAWMGIAAASIIFLSKYAGMVSLAQVALYAIAGFTTANLVHASEGTHVGLTPWLAVFIGIAVCLLFGFLF